MGDLRAVVEAVRERVDLVDLIARDIELKPAGSVLKGSSPFRSDSDPSFVLWPHSQTWRDFSGGEGDGGDCFDYIQQRDNVPFMEALRVLASGVGVQVPGVGGRSSNASVEQVAERRGVERLLTEAAAYYHGALPPEVQASWLEERYGFNQETISKLQLGWADGQLYAHLTQKLGATEAQALATGLFVRFKDGRVVDFFQRRLIFPYWRRGRVVYFIARRTETTADEPWEQAKYKKLLTRSEKHPYVSACVINDTFYNEDAARGAKQLLITEGVTDCISAMQAGVACISPVTVRFRRKDLPKLLKLSQGAQEIIIANDAEESGAGADGAADTASALYAAGRYVRIAVLPRPEGADKIDLNELIAQGGELALKRVMSEAQGWCEHLINQIPGDASPRELDEHLKPIIPLILSATPIMREAHVKQLKARFSLASATINATLRAEAQIQPDRSDPQPDSEDERRRLKGALIQARDHYFAFDNEGEPIRVSNFIMKVKRWVTAPEGDLIDVDILIENGKALRNITFARDAWASRRGFIRSLKSSRLTWTGSDDNVQALLYLLSLQDAPTYQATMNLGYGEDSRGPYWITSHDLIEPIGQEGLHRDIIWVDTGGAFHKRISPYPRVALPEERALAAEVLPRLLKLNTPEVILPIIGWFFAAPLRPRIFKAHRSFPNLCVFGTQGSGKTSLIVKIFWPLLGLPQAVPFSATETEFTLVRLLSATNSIPVFIDEYKPADMPKRRLESIHRFLRRLYTGETEQRGRPDLTVVDHFLTAPLLLGGESRPIEPALAERMITSNPSKTTIEENPHHIQAFKHLEAMDLSRLSRGIIQHLLSRDVVADHKSAAGLLNDYLEELDHQIPHRVRFNLEVIILGLICFDDYARKLEIQIPEIDLKHLIKGQIDDLLEGRHQVKSSLDYFLEILSSLAISEDIEYDKQYTYSRGYLAIHLSSCHSAYSAHCKRTNYIGEIIDLRALRRLVREDHHRKGYVIETTAPTSFDGTKRRTVIIDMNKAKSQLDIDDFPQKKSPPSFLGV